MNTKAKNVGLLALLSIMTVACLGTGISTKAAAKKLNKKKAVMYTGGTLTLKVKKAKASSVRWKSSKKTIATVKKGKVTALKKGKVTITAKTGKQKLKCKITVNSNSLNRKSVTVYQNGSFQMKATHLKKGIIKGWRSANPDVASISTTGLIKGNSLGSTDITVSLKSETYTCHVIVVAALSREDFHAEFTDEKNNSYTNFIDYAKYWNYPTDYINADGSDKTKRGIGTGAYGEGRKETITFTTGVVTYVLEGLDTGDATYFYEYTYSEGGAKYQLRFYFNKNNKVTLLLLAKGLS
ncbi:MAG: Ig-like domain-containing protein [Lachnospiraceae bacterium]|nr:Ig-like domain-containing protein [Lachnospiraceae bacterium]